MGYIFQVIIAKVIAGFFGKYTLMFWYKLTKNEEGMEWLNKPEDEMAELTGNCFITLVGLTVFTILFIGIFEIIDYIKFNY